MAVARVEQYRQQDGSDILKVILMPTKKFPVGYFYTDTWAIDLVQGYTWRLLKDKKGVYVTTKIYRRELLKYHQLLALKILGCMPDCIDHISGVGIDNLDANLNVADSQKNARNKPSRGYSYNKRNKSFQPYITLAGEMIYNSICKSEVEVAIKTCEMRKFYYNDYDYNFLLDRRGELDILALERTGKISAEEAIYRHVMKYAWNAWYYYRYGLQGYFEEYHIPVPRYELDAESFMVHPITGERLCPF